MEESTLFIYNLLRLMHIVCFGLWIGAVAASFLITLALKPYLTSAETAKSYSLLLRKYISLEVKLVDVAFAGVAITGVLLAQFYTGWSLWAATKLFFYLVQFAATMFSIRKWIVPLVYPCSEEDYKNWGKVFLLSSICFSLTLLWTFFGK